MRGGHQRATCSRAGGRGARRAAGWRGDEGRAERSDAAPRRAAPRRKACATRCEPRRGRAERSADAGAGDPQRARLRAGADAAHLAVFAAREEVTTARGPGDAEDVVLVRLERRLWQLGVRVPQPHRVVARARDEQTAVSAERSREDGLWPQRTLGASRCSAPRRGRGRRPAARRRSGSGITCSVLTSLPIAAPRLRATSCSDT